MSETGDAQATGGLTVADAAAVFETMLADSGDSEGVETLEGEAPQAEDEDDAPAAESETEEQSEEGDETDDSEEQPPTYRVKVAGEEVEVPLPELLKGYSREKDYSRKTMAHAEEVRTFEAEKQSFSAERERTTNLLQALEQTFQAPAYTQEQLDYLRATDPVQYGVAVADNQRRGEQAALVQAERRRLESQAQSERTKALEDAKKSEQARLLELRPDWQDEAKAKTAMDLARAAGKAIGVSDEEFDSNPDHRVKLALWKAAQWDAIQSKKPAVQAKVEQVKTAKPGSAVKPGKATDVTRASQRLAQTGRVEDAAAVFMHLQR